MAELRFLLVALFLYAFVLSCGSGSGGGSSSGGAGNEGATDTGTIVSATIAPETYDVDYCTDTTEAATATLDAVSINEALPSNILSTESYTVTFTPADSAAPLIEGGTFTDSRTLPAEGFPVSFIGSSAKQAMRQAVAQAGASSSYYSYVASYEFSGGDLYGSSWNATGTFTFSVGRYSTCPVTIYPPSATVTGISNPDADTSDDLTFSISFGTGPYTVYSDNAAITAPGALGAGVSSFTADPDQVATETTVTLTVTDSLGASGTITITISPSLLPSVTVYPSSVAVTGVANPDADTSDDLVFNIVSGTGPYTVYSSDGAVIAAPGTLGAGVSSFTADPDQVTSETVVALTVVDSLGAMAAVTVTISTAALAVNPSTAAVSGLNNPDGDVSDDLLFAITGGTGPYIVYSDNAAITAPGELGEGVASFTVDPVSVASDTAATLTVADSLGATATALVTVTP